MNDSIHILVVDDNKKNLGVVSSYLKEEKYKLTLALNGTEALKVLSRDNVDLVLLDIMMPGMDGFEVCTIINETPEIKDIPVIFLTARTDTEDIVKGFNIGGVDYITKPFNKEELIVRVRNHVELKLMRDYLKQQAERNKDERNSMMKTLLDFGKTMHDNK